MALAKMGFVSFGTGHILQNHIADIVAFLRLPQS